MFKIRKIPIIFCLLSLNIVLPIPCKSQNSDVSITNISIEDGLSQSQISFIIQDSKGFLWIGTQDGLNKYDGYSFKVFRNNPVDSTSISSNSIKSIIEDSKGNIWVGTRAGLNKYYRKSGNFRSFFHDPNNRNSLGSNNIEALNEDRAGNIWVKTPDKLDKLDPLNDKFIHFEFFNDYFNPVLEERIDKIIEDYKGNIWFGTKDGLNVFDPNSELIKRYYYDSLDDKSISNNNIHVIIEDMDRNLLVGTSNGLNLFNRRHRNFQRFYISKNKSENRINKIYEDHSGLIWIGTDEGLLYFNKKDGKFTSSIDKNHFDLKGLINSKISEITQDYSNIFWIGIWEMGEIGLHKIDVNKKRFKLYKKTGNNSLEFLSNNIASILVDDENNLWIGNWDGGLNVFDRQTETVKNFVALDDFKSLPNNCVLSLMQDSKGDIWIGTQNGLIIYRKSLNRFISLYEKFNVFEFQIFANKRINSIIEDKAGNIWIGSQNGLHKFNYRTKISYLHNKGVENSLYSNYINCIIEDKSRNIWIGTNDGLDKLDLKKNKFIHYSKSYNSSQGISNNTILSLFEDENEIIWIGTEAGLNKFDIKTGLFKFYLQKDGFANDCINGILEDNFKNLWISSNRGISRFNPKIELITNFDLKDGLQAYKFNQGAYFKTKEGELFFGGISGLNAFFPDSIYKNKIRPKISFTAIEKIGKDGIIKQNIDEIEDLIITPTDYMFNFEFASLEFTRPEKNQYQIIMEGLDNEWINIGTRHYASYTQIPAGTYVFKVKSSNNDLIWNDEGISVRVIVKPSFFKSKFAYFVYIVLLISIVLILIQYRTRSLRLSNQVLKEKQITSQEIARQKEELSHKNKNITDSMHYAQRIIEAMVPSIKSFKRVFPESFILYLPKDIVSGDFYWIAEKGDKVFFAAVDCTGHGIPGAFMSIIGFDLLRSIVNVQGIEDPAEILNLLNKGVADTFRDAEDMTVSDGMDLAFCVLDRKNRILQYAGAFNPLYLIRNNNILDYKADRFSVGLAEDLTQQSFQKHEIKIEENDVIYIFSDGYADQFGGPSGKKFKFRRFRHLLLTIHKLSMEQQERNIRESISKWRGGYEQVDDILIIGIKII